MGGKFVFFDAIRLGDHLPNDDRLSFSRFWLQRDDDSQWSVGLDVENTSNTEMRLEIGLRKAHEDGFSIRDDRFDLIVRPGERHRSPMRIWGNAKKDFKRAIIRDIKVGPSSEAEWSATSSPNQSVYDLLDMDRISLRSPAEMLGLGLAGVLATVAIVFVCGIMVLFFWFLWVL
jgi:hypothetical protein